MCLKIVLILFWSCFGLVSKKTKNKTYTIDIWIYVWYNDNGYIWKISDAFPFYILWYRKVVVNYDKKRDISIYYNPTIIFYSNHLTI